MRPSLLVCLSTSMLMAALATGCNGNQSVRAETAVAPAGKIAPQLASVASRLENGSIQPPLTGLVRSDAAGNIQVYVHVTDTSDAHLAELGKHGLQNMLASPALSIVQGWVKPQNLAGLAALPFVTRITPPRYAIPR